MTPTHNYHLVNPSPWPFLTSWSLFYITLGLTLSFHYHIRGGTLCFIGFLLLLTFFYVWLRDVVREGTFSDHHPWDVEVSLRIGMLFFILSEVLFFVSFFWAFFHSSLSPSVVIGATWPPNFFIASDMIPLAWNIPFLNTLLLLFSGLTLTIAHHYLMVSNIYNTAKYLFKTILLAIIFLCVQGGEYYDAEFSISDGIYGSCFYLTTGFHGIHVIIGTIFLCVVLVRVILGHLSQDNQLSFETGAWYWHFVDIVWLYLFLAIYIWGNSDSIFWLNPDYTRI